MPNLRRFFLVFCFVFAALPVWAQGILFGEKKALTVLSSLTENPFALPTSVFTISAEEISRRGYLTLAEALSTIPGFYLGRSRWGSRAYLRGIPEGVLFLYDGMPLTSDSTKALSLLDEEISLEALERIEVVLGPGSVLWGPDAFAGVVNLVPRRAEKNSLRVRTFWGTPFRDKKIFADFSYTARFWRAYLAFGWWKRNFDRSEEHGLSEAIFNLQLWPGVRISGRWSGGERGFLGRDDFYGISWPGKRRFPVNFLKAEFRKAFPGWSLLLRGYTESIHPKTEDLDFELSYKTHVLGVEAIVSRELFRGEGLFNLGFGYRKNWVRDAVVTVRGLLSEYLVKLPYFRPLVDRENFDTDLVSAFFQFRQRMGSLELFAGARFDAHSEYRPGWSFSGGFLYASSPRWSLKFMAGSAYRTPYAAEFLGKSPSPERLYTLSLELALSPRPDLSLRFMPFYSYLRRMVEEDPFGGFSEPLSQRFWGLGFRFHWHPRSRLEVTLDFFRLWNHGDEERFHVLQYMIYHPETGEKEAYYQDYTRSYDYGASSTGNLCFYIKAFEHLDVFMRLHFVGKRYFEDLRTSRKKKLSPTVTADLFLRRRWGRGRIFLAFKDLFDRAPKHSTGIAAIPSDGFRFYMGLGYDF